MIMPVKKQNVTILGSTGSVGVNTLNVLALHPDRYDLHALTANSNWETLAEQCCAFKPKFAVLKQRESVPALEDRLLHAGCKTKVLAGKDGLCAVAANNDVDVVMAAIVGGAGLEPTLAAVKAGPERSGPR